MKLKLRFAFEARLRRAHPGGTSRAGATHAFPGSDKRFRADDRARCVAPAENKTEEPIFSGAGQDLVEEGGVVAPGERDASGKELHQQRRTRSQFNQSEIGPGGNKQTAFREHGRRQIGKRFHLAVGLFCQRSDVRIRQAGTRARPVRLPECSAKARRAIRQNEHMSG